jgi:crotonobetaine/carnitine-CoA ligase
MTETITHGIVGSLTEEEPAFSIGRCARGYEIAVVRSGGEGCEAGETGELLIRGVPGLSLFSHYLNDPDATEAAFDDQGYMITGDRVTLGENGYVFFADRVKDMLKVGGEHVAASEIEGVALRTAGVAEAVAVGSPDPMLDEVPVLFVVTLPGVDHKQLRSRLELAYAGELADFKRPRSIHFVSDLPRATLEKVNKAELRARLRAEQAARS